MKKLILIPLLWIISCSPIDSHLPQTAHLTTDVRPIGILHLSAPERITLENPHGWYFQELAGGARNINPYVLRSLDVCKRQGIQALIIWDPEGAADGLYLGSPDSAKQINADWDFIDDLFKIYTSYGYKVGCTLRVEEYNPQTRKLERSPDPYKTLLRKATYAYKRWGCRYFYVDSNFWYVFDNPAVPLPVDMFVTLSQKLPGAKFFPEHECWGDPNVDPKVFWTEVSYFNKSIPYMELRMGETNVPTRIKAMNPYAMAAINLSEGDIPANFTALRAAIKSGSVIPMINIWWWSKNNQDLADLLSN